MEELLKFRSECVEAMKALAEDVATRSGEEAEKLAADFDQLEAWVTQADERIALNVRAAELEASAPQVAASADEPKTRAAFPAVVTPKADSPTQEHPLEVLHNRWAYGEAEYNQRVRSAALQVLEDKCFAPEHAAEAEAKLRGHGIGVSSEDANGVEFVARHVVTYGNDDYIGGFQKLAGGSLEPLTEAEIRAVQIGSGHGSGGEVVVPTHLDPTVVLNNSGSQSDIRRMGDNVTLVEGNVWNGVSSAGVSLTWVAEGVEHPSDDSPTFVGKAIPVHMSQAYLEASIEALQDIAGLDATFVNLLADGRDQQLNTIFVTGTGTAQPTGVLTALDAVVASEVATDAVGVLDADDVYDLRYVELPVRWRDRSSWLMADGITAAIRQFGTNDANFSVDITADGVRTLMGRPIGASESLDNAVATGNNVAILGDFSHFKIVQRMGVTVERIQNVMGANQRPTGKRGVVMYSRVGSDCHITEPFRLLQVA
ncbi:MAG: phage major capsid protein [Acidimicrobiia bacterium]|nr:phage major capsid protein [Acidimicrobiia bacterium]